MQQLWLAAETIPSSLALQYAQPALAESTIAYAANRQSSGAPERPQQQLVLVLILGLRVGPQALLLLCSGTAVVTSRTLHNTCKKPDQTWHGSALEKTLFHQRWVKRENRVGAVPASRRRPSTEPCFDGQNGTCNHYFSLLSESSTQDRRMCQPSRRATWRMSVAVANTCIHCSLSRFI